MKVKAERLIAIAKFCAPSLSVGIVLGAVVFLSPWMNEESTPPWSVFVQPIGEPPEIMATAFRDTNGSWHLTMDTKNFVFSDLCNGDVASHNEGHVHIYLGEEKVGTAFFPAYDLGPLPTGKHELRLMVRATDHRPYAGPDGAVLAKITVKVPDPLFPEKIKPNVPFVSSRLAL